MDKLTVIEAIIQTHGARTVFEATFEWKGSDYASLEAMGFTPMLEDADRVPYVACIAYIAYHRMSAEERASNYWDGSLALHRLRGQRRNVSPSKSPPLERYQRKSISNKIAPRTENHRQV